MASRSGLVAEKQRVVALEMEGVYAVKAPNDKVKVHSRFGDETVDKIVIYMTRLTKKEAQGCFVANLEATCDMVEKGSHVEAVWTKHQFYFNK